MKVYKHKEIGNEVRFISGYYTFEDEIQVNFGNRKVLCAVGIGVVDNACCGTGGCYFVEVPGYIVSWKNATDDNGRFTSQVEPIETGEAREAIKAELHQLYPLAQINFD
jgi:hypothetical protein